MLQAPFFLNCACLIKFIYVCFLCMACVVSCNSHSFFRLPACLLALYTFISCFDSQLQPPKCQVFFLLVEQHLLNLDKFVLYPQTFYILILSWFLLNSQLDLVLNINLETSGRFSLLIFRYDDKGQTLFRSSFFFSNLSLLHRYVANLCDFFIESTINLCKQFYGSVKMAIN